MDHARKACEVRRNFHEALRLVGDANRKPVRKKRSGLDSLEWLG